MQNGRVTVALYAEQYTDMYESTQAPRQEEKSLPSELLAFYDEFSEFNDYCAFFCDAFANVASLEGGLDDSSIQGMKRSAQWMKERMDQ